MKFGLKNASIVLNKLFRDKRLSNIVFSKAMYDMVYMAYAYRWETVRRDEIYYPTGGMQAIPDAAVAALYANGGELLLNTEAVKILIKDGAACGVACADGREFFGRAVISNASPQYTANTLAAEAKELAAYRKSIAEKRIFPGCMMCFVGVSADYDFGGANFIAITDESVLDTPPQDYTPENCPIQVIVSQRPQGQREHSLVVLAPLGYHYQNNWHTQDGKRGAQYRALKASVSKTIMERVSQRLGKAFAEAVLFTVPSTPVTFERYTYSAEGSFMGWSIKAGDYGKFLPQETAVKNLYMVGQWVFPGFGIAGVMASGYYLAKALLKADNIDLEERFKEFYDTLKR